MHIFRKAGIKFIKEHVEKNAPGAYMIALVRDLEPTGKFEVTVFDNETDLKNRVQATLVHTKLKTGKFPWGMEQTDIDKINQIIIKNSGVK